MAINSFTTHFSSATTTSNRPTEGYSGQFLPARQITNLNSLPQNTESLRPAKQCAYRVLVIEDNPHIAHLISVNLTRGGVESKIALNGAAGLEDFQANPPHLVLLDLMMPVMDGFQVCEKIRQLSSVPIVIMTARLEPIHQMRGFRLGADDYVLKPFDPQLLAARVIAHLRRIYRYDGERIHHKDLSFSPPASSESTLCETGNHPSDMSENSGDEKSDHSFSENGMTYRDERGGEVLSHLHEGWASCGA